MNTSEKYLIPIVIVCLVLFLINPVVCFLVVGLLAFGYVIISAFNFKKIQRKGIECTGEIVSYQANAKGYKTPVISFTAIDGQIICATPFVYASSSFDILKSGNKNIGKKVLVLYDRDNPERFILKESASNYFSFILG